MSSNVAGAPVDLTISFDWRVVSHTCFDPGPPASEIHLGLCGSRRAGVGAEGEAVVEIEGTFDAGAGRTTRITRLDGDLLGFAAPLLADAQPLLVTPDRIAFVVSDDLRYHAGFVWNRDGTGEAVWFTDEVPMPVVIYALSNLQVSGVPGWPDGPLA